MSNFYNTDIESNIPTNIISTITTNTTNSIVAVATTTVTTGGCSGDGINCIGAVGGIIEGGDYKSTVASSSSSTSLSSASANLICTFTENYNTICQNSVNEQHENQQIKQSLQQIQYQQQRQLRESKNRALTSSSSSAAAAAVTSSVSSSSSSVYNYQQQQQQQYQQQQQQQQQQSQLQDYSFDNLNNDGIIAAVTAIAIAPDVTFNRNILDMSLDANDPALMDLIIKEKERQRYTLNMIANENYTSVAVLQCLSSCLHNKLSDGYPGKRFYCGNKYIDKIELLAQERALAAFNLNSSEWGVNVQSYASSPANLAVYMGLLRPHDRIMGLDLTDGGDIMHGYMTARKRISSSSIFYESMPYKVCPYTNRIDYEALAANAQLFKPKLIIAGTTSYPRILSYRLFRNICDDIGCYLLADISNIAGMMAAGVIPSAFQYADIVMTTTDKTLRGPNGAVIFYRRGTFITKQNGCLPYDFETRINNAVFPGLQGGPHNNTIAAIATAFHQTKTDAFIKYQHQILANTRRLANGLANFDYEIVTGGTDLHLVLVDLTTRNLTGSQAEIVLEKVGIICNRTPIPNEKILMYPSGILFGTSALTSRGIIECDIDKIVVFIDSAINICIEALHLAQYDVTPFLKVVTNYPIIVNQIKNLHANVAKFIAEFSLPGLEVY